MKKCENINCQKEHDGKYGSGRFCSPKCARSFSRNLKREETNKKVSEKMKGYKYGNAGKTYPIIEIKKKCVICGKIKIIKTTSPKRKFRETCSDLCFRKYQSIKCKETGGYRKGSGRSIGGYYKGIYCHSSYELIFLAYHLEIGTEIKKCKRKFPYYYKGKKFNYFPDFEIENKIIEIKGFHNKLVDIKKESVLNSGFDFEIYYGDDLKPMLDFLRDKFDLKEISELYDSGGKPKFKHICDFCGIEYENYKKESIFCSRKCTGLNNCKLARIKKNEKKIC